MSAPLVTSAEREQCGGEKGQPISCGLHEISVKSRLGTSHSIARVHRRTYTNTLKCFGTGRAPTSASPATRGAGDRAPFVRRICAYNGVVGGSSSAVVRR